MPMNLLNATENFSLCMHRLSSLACLSSRSRRDLSLTLNRFIGTELHGEESSVAFSRSIGVELDFWRAAARTCENLKYKYSFVQHKITVYGHKQASKQASRHTHVFCNAVTLVWGSLRLATITTVLLLFAQAMSVRLHIDLTLMCEWNHCCTPTFYSQPESVHNTFTRLRWTQHLVQLEMEWNLHVPTLNL